ncbi:acyl-CoA thioesterase, partial [Mesorhizobium sp. M4B.F.Ca.ET.169.01.1.1]
FDLTARASVALDEPMRDRAAAFLVE